MSVYQDSITAAIESIAEFGREVTFTKEEKGVIDPITGKFPEPIKTNYLVDAVTFDYSDKNAGSGQIEGTTIKTGDKKVLIASGAYTPNSSDMANIDGIDYNIVNVITVAPSGEPILYEIQVRR